MVKLIPLCSLFLLMACGSAGSPEQGSTTTTTPQTGDTTNILPYIFALIASALAIMLNFSKKIVKKNQ